MLGRLNEISLLTPLVKVNTAEVVKMFGEVVVPAAPP
jgi:hypothetical protein